MKRFWTSLATFSLVETIGRHPALAGALMLLGVGGGVGVALLTTPALVPQPAAYFNQNQNFGTTNNALKLNAGNSGAMQPPTSNALNSQAIYMEMQVNPGLGQGNSGSEFPIGIMALEQNGVTGSPAFILQRYFAGQLNTPWFMATGPLSTSGSGAFAGSNYNTGFYPFTMTGGGCAREPSGVWEGNTGTVQWTDPGFLCPATVPALAASAIPDTGAQQSTGAGSIATTCVSNSPISSEMTVTAHVAVAHGYTPGMTYTLQGFAQAGFNATYTALFGTTGTTLVGETTTGGGACPSPTASSEGTAFSGTGASIAALTTPVFPPFNNAPVGITTKNGQHICMAIIENGADSPFPGSQAISAVDDQGNALSGAPALTPWLNQGTANATGYISSAAQSSGSPALTITSLNSYSLTSPGAVFTGGANSTVTFTVSTNPGFIAGSEFTVAGVSPSGYNQTYVTLSQTGSGPYTITANPLSGPAGTLQTISNPGSYVSGGSLASVILPGMQILGSSNSGNYVLVSPYGAYGSTATGATGTYGLGANTATSSVSVSSITAGPGSATMVVTGSPSPLLVVGSTLTVPGYSSNVVVTNIGTTGGSAGSYTVSNPNSTAISSAVTATNTGAVGSSGTPVNLFFYPGYYYTAAASPNPAGGTVTARTASQLTDFFNTVGSSIPNISGSLHNGWGGSIGNVANLWGVFPQQTGGAPSTTALASLCKKTTDIPAFASANGMTVNALYRLNDQGIWGDSSRGDFTGSLTSNALTVTAGIPSVAWINGTIISGAGITGCPSACPTVTGSTSTSSYTLSGGGTVASEAMKAGGFAPAAQNTPSTVTGSIAGSTLTVTALPTSSGSVNFTGSLGTQFTASISGNTLTITNPLPNGTTFAVAGVGMTVVVPGGTNATITAQLTSTAANGVLGQGGTYTISGSAQTVASETMFGTNSSAPLPGSATALFNVTVTSGTLVPGMYITDGGASLTAQPLLITGVSGSGGTGSIITVAGNYYPSIIADATMVASLSSLVPGTYLFNSSITTPVKILSYQGPCSIAGAVNGGLGCYNLSSSANGTIASTNFTASSISDGGAIAPGPALTIRDQGPGVTFPVTSSLPISCSSFGSCTGTGALFLSGTYDTSTIGGFVSAVQAQVSLSANGPPVPGCAACAWTNLASYSANLSSGTVHNWSGQALSIPAGGPYYVSVRAANGTAYATLPNSVKVGLVHDGFGQGQFQTLPTTQGGVNWSYFSGLWGAIARRSPYGTGNESYLLGPPIAGNLAPSQSTNIAGDRFGITGTGQPLSEGIGTLEQLLTNAFGWPSSFLDDSHDGVGITLQTLGNAAQTQTVGVGNGSQTTWCSASTFCSNASVAGPLYFNAASLTGATLAGATLSAGPNGVLSVPATTGLVLGALSPGMFLTGAGVGSGVTLSYCTSGCTISAYTISAPTAQQWVTNYAGSAITSGEAMRVDPAGGTAPWAGFNAQVGGLPFNLLGYGTQLIKAGTFAISVNGTVVCQDTQTFAYNNTGGNCTDMGGGVVSSTGTFVNYQTGDYQVTFTSGHAPANNAVITASWTNIISPEPNSSPPYNRPQGVDFVGNGTQQSGFISAQFSRTPGGTSGHINAGCSTDENYIIQNQAVTNIGYQFGAPGYSQMVSNLYGSKFPSLIPGMSAATPYISSGQYRGEGPVEFTVNGSYKLGVCDQWMQDIATYSTFSGTIASGSPAVLTLTANAVGPMWEGEIIGCAPFSTSCAVPPGVYIKSLASGSWGASGSTYNLGGSPATVSSALAMQNAAYYSGPGPTIYAGPLYDIDVTNTGLTTNYSPHMWDGITGGRRNAARLAATIWGGMTSPQVAGTPPANASPPSLDRVQAHAAGCDSSALASPCFDIGNTYAATASGVGWVAFGGGNGGVFTVTGGLAAHARPFVVGQVVNCSPSCGSNLTIISVSAPPTQSTISGAGQIGNTFTFQVIGTMSGSGTSTVTAGCSGTAGTGSNCIDMAFSVNTTGGTYGTAAALATCGENNLASNTPNYQTPNGVCHDNGIGELTRGFRIGTSQFMYGTGTTFPLGSVFDDGIDFFNGAFNQSAAFTCNIVAAKIVQCVKGPAYTSGVPSGFGRWAAPISGVPQTFVNYGDQTLVSGRFGSVLGYVGGQSFPITNGGTGYSNQTVTATGCTPVASGAALPQFSIGTSGGVIVDVYPANVSAAMGYGLGGACTITPSGGTGAVIPNIVVAPVEGVGGIGTVNTDSNTMGTFLYDNTGFVGNPLNAFFTNGQGGYFEPGLPVRPFGEFQGAAVSG